MYIRNKKYIDFGKGLTTGYRCRFGVDCNHSDKYIIVGENINFGDDVRILCSNHVEIGNNVLFAGKILVVDNLHGCYRGNNQSSPEQAPNEREIFVSPIVTGYNVWIGEGAVIQQGVTIGEGAIIATNSVITKDIPNNTIVGGIPA